MRAALRVTCGPIGRLDLLHMLICRLALPWVRAADLREQIRATLAPYSQIHARGKLAKSPVRSTKPRRTASTREQPRLHLTAAAVVADERALSFRR